MKSRYIICVLILLATTLLIFSCKKEDLSVGRVAWETYINKSGYDMEIIRYLNHLPEKKFTIKKDSTLIIITPMDEGADTTGTIRHADSAKVIYNGVKTYLQKNTSSLKTNFLNSKNFVSTISPNSKINYLRYTFTEADYKLAE